VVFGKTDGAAVSLASVAAGAGGGFKIIGQDPDDRAGQAVAGLDDVNGDGLADVLIGAPFHHLGNRGAAYIVFGKADGAAVNLDNVASGIGGIKFEGLINNDGVGSAVAGLGDVNGDGRADLMFGAPGGVGVGAGAGFAQVLFSQPDWDLL
jgi:hypothetical protein